MKNKKEIETTIMFPSVISVLCDKESRKRLLKEAKETAPENKDKVVESLRSVQKRICAYGSETFCDCKYGHGFGNAYLGGEQNGCPEVRVAIHILSVMSKKDYKYFLTKKTKHGRVS